MLIFVLGVLLGVGASSTLGVRFLRRVVADYLRREIGSCLQREIADDIGPKLKRIQLQLDCVQQTGLNTQAELNLAAWARYAEQSAHLTANPSPHQD